jgi:hypothetical protein
MKCYSTEEKGAARDCIETFCSNSNSSNSIDYIKLLKEQLLKIYSENVVRLILNNINIDITKKVISKSEAKILCKTEGIELKGEVTYATLNKTELTYWANPNKKVLYGDWWLLLIDSKKYKFHH